MTFNHYCEVGSIAAIRLEIINSAANLAKIANYIKCPIAHDMLVGFDSIKRAKKIEALSGIEFDHSEMHKVVSIMHNLKKYYSIKHCDFGMSIDECLDDLDATMFLDWSSDSTTREMPVMLNIEPLVFDSSRLTINMINGGGYNPFTINLHKLSELLIDAVYVPDELTGIKLYYQAPDKRITIIVQSSGYISVKGCKTHKQLSDAYQFTIDTLLKYKNDIEIAAKPIVGINLPNILYIGQHILIKKSHVKAFVDNVKRLKILME
jgi:hypothetical protein